MATEHPAAFPVLGPSGTTVVSFQAHKPTPPRGFSGEIIIEEPDPNEYVFEIATSIAGSVAASLSNRSAGLFDANLRSVGSIPHEGIITDISFDPTHPHLLFTSSDDSYVRW